MKVSVVIATYTPNMFEHFKECVESVQNQSYEDVEIVCIVDGNNEYFEKIKAEFPEIVVHLNEKNYGLLISRNRGVQLSNGHVVAFIDDDAVADENWIEELVKMYKAGAIAAGGKLLPLWLTKKPRWLPEEFYWMIGATHLGFPETVMEVRNTFGSNLSFRRDVFLELGGFNTKMGGIKGSKMLQGGETELCERMRKTYGKGVMYNPKAVVYHKIFPNRVKFSFLVKRAFWQGYSKALMENILGDVSEERSFLRFLTKRGFYHLKNGLKGNRNELEEFFMVFFFTFLVGLGYSFQKVQNLG